MARRINKLLSIVLVVCMLLSMMPAAVFAATPDVVYLKPNSEWLVDNARFAAYFFQGDSNTWVSMTDSDGDGYYEAAVPSGYGSVIFCRMNPSGSNDWTNKWNQTADLALPTDGTNCWTLNSGDWAGGGSWSSHGGSVDYYLFGFINGANYACEEDAANLGTFKFASGKLTVTFTSDSYVAVRTNQNGWYMTKSYDATATSVTLYQGGSEKMFVPGGVKVTFTLKVNTDGTLTLSYTMDTSTCAHSAHDTEGNCTVCGKLVGHNWDDGSCSDCGADCSHTWSGGTCSICGSVCGHSYDNGKVTTAATCTKAGVKTYTCTVCGVTKTESIAATGHSYDNGKVTTAATCTKAGVKTYTCTKCGVTKTESIPSTGHSYTSSVTAPTCTASGYTTHTCSGCGDSYKDSTTAATGHNYVNGTCTKCGDGCSHSYDSGKVTTAATCTKAAILRIPVPSAATATRATPPPPQVTAITAARSPRRQPAPKQVSRPTPAPSVA